MTEQIEQKKELGEGDAGTVAYWLKEIELSSKAEENWRKYAKKVLEIYEGESEKRHANDTKSARSNEFNILWSNTETLKPALYNSTPRPDVRRRFRDKDPLGRVVAEVIERGCSFSIDSYDFDGLAEDVVHDYLLPGRAVARVRYVPTFGKTNEVVYEEVPCELVQWDKFRVGYAKNWKDVPWIAFEHELSRDDLIAQFGEKLGKTIGLDIERDTDDQEANADAYKRARVWEIWHKEKKQVLFVAPSYKVKPLKIISDPLNLRGFFPIPKPLYSIQKTSSLVPTCEYSLYEAQAEELDRVTKRINRITSALKVRGVYDSTITEMASLFDQDDNKFIPAENVAQIYNLGGLEKAIWMLPIDKLITVLRELVQQREAIKAVIYEITGIADILRGASDSNETLGAQQIKQNWAGLRLKKRQAAVQRFMRDLLRLKAELIAEKFSPETLSQMTGFNFPTSEQKQAAQMAIRQSQMVQQQPDPQALQVMQQPTWDEILGILRDDATRAYRIDIETDSTIEGARQDEQKNVSELLQGITGFVQAAAPAAQTGLLPAPAIKAMLMACVRRFKLGREVEDEIDKIGNQQEQRPDPEAEKLKAELDLKKQSLQAEIQMKREKQQADIELEREKLPLTLQLEREKHMMTQDTERYKADRMGFTGVGN